MGNNESLLLERPKNRLIKPRTAFTLPRSLSMIDLPESFDPIMTPQDFADVGPGCNSKIGEDRNGANFLDKRSPYLSDSSRSEYNLSSEAMEEWLTDTSSSTPSYFLNTPKSFHQSQAQCVPSLNNRVDSVAGTPTLPVVSHGENVDLKATISMLRELAKTATQEDLFALHEALQPADYPWVYQHRRWSVHSSSLIRKRSLATPGVATRNESVASIHRPKSITGTKLKLEQVARRTKARSLPSAVPFSMTDPKDHYEESGVMRAPTPADMSYLGLYKLGSLVVTNGAASPEPAAHGTGSSDVDFGSDKVYYTASEGRCSSETLLLPLATSSISASCCGCSSRCCERGVMPACAQLAIQQINAMNKEVDILQSKEALQSQSKSGNVQQKDARCRLERPSLQEAPVMHKMKEEMAGARSRICTDVGNRYIDQYNDQSGHPSSLKCLFKLSDTVMPEVAATKSDGLPEKCHPNIPELTSMRGTICSNVPLATADITDQYRKDYKHDLLSFHENIHLKEKGGGRFSRSRHSEDTAQVSDDRNQRHDPTRIHSVWAASTSPRTTKENAKKDSVVRSMASLLGKKYQNQDVAPPTLSTFCISPGGFEHQHGKKNSNAPERNGSTPDFPFTKQPQHRIANTVPEVQGDVNMRFMRRLNQSAESEPLDYALLSTSCSFADGRICTDTPDFPAIPLFSASEDKVSDLGTFLDGSESSVNTAASHCEPSQSNMPTTIRHEIDKNPEAQGPYFQPSCKSDVVANASEENCLSDVFSSWNRELPPWITRPYESASPSSHAEDIKPTSAVQELETAPSFWRKTPWTLRPSTPVSRRVNLEDDAGPRPKTAHGIDWKEHSPLSQTTRRSSGGTTLAQRAIARRKSFYAGKAAATGEAESCCPAPPEQLDCSITEATRRSLGIASDTNNWQQDLQFRGTDTENTQMPSLSSIRGQAELRWTKLNASSGRPELEIAPTGCEDASSGLSLPTRAMLSQWEAQTGSDPPGRPAEAQQGSDRQSRLWSRRRKSLGGQLLAKFKAEPPTCRIVTPTIVVSRYITPTKDSFPAEVSQEVQMERSARSRDWIAFGRWRE